MAPKGAAAGLRAMCTASRRWIVLVGMYIPQLPKRLLGVIQPRTPDALHRAAAFSAAYGRAWLQCPFQRQMEQ